VGNGFVVGDVLENVSELVEGSELAIAGRRDGRGGRRVLEGMHEVLSGGYGFVL